MRVLITGANGHVGANTVRAALERGHEVVAFVRERSDLRGLEGLDVDYAYGDMLDRDSVRKAAAGCEAIIHTAAVFRLWAKDPEAIMQPALVGARNIFEAAQEAGVQRLIYTSSLVAMGSDSSRDVLLTAEDWNENPHSPYLAAKTASERAAWQLSEEYGIPLIVLCPGGILGPLDYRITPSMETLRGYADGSGQSFNGGLGWVDVRDVGAIHALALEKGTPGTRYVLVTENLPAPELARMVSALTGKSVRHLGFGRGLARILAGMMEAGARLTGGEPLMTRAIVDDYVGRYQFADGRPTYEDFGHTPYDFDQTIRDSLAWLAEIGELDQEVAAKAAG